MLCSIYSDNFQKKKKKRRLGSSAAAEDENSIGQPDADVILSKLKQSSVAEYDAIRERIQSCMQNNFTAENVKLAVTVSSASIYLLGRYRKLARDVPQAAWTIDNERRGRNSVEEIVSEQVVKILRARSCRMHACGREDIDVRCLGEHSSCSFILQHIRLHSTVVCMCVHEQYKCTRRGACMYVCSFLMSHVK